MPSSSPSFPASSYWEPASWRAGTHSKPRTAGGRSKSSWHTVWSSASESERSYLTTHAVGQQVVEGLHRESHIFARRAIAVVVVAFLVLAFAIGGLALVVNNQFHEKDARLSRQSAVIALAISDIEANCTQLAAHGGSCPDYTKQLRQLDGLLGQ